MSRHIPRYFHGKVLIIFSLRVTAFFGIARTHLFMLPLIEVNFFKPYVKHLFLRLIGQLRTLIHSLWFPLHILFILACYNLVLKLHSFYRPCLMCCTISNVGQFLKRFTGFFLLPELLSHLHLPDQ
jgi:hypothetical protein